MIFAGLAAFAETQFPAHKVAGNLYYVGSVEYAAYLVATSEGHILVNSSFPESVPLIEESVARLGFKFTDIKILLTSHAHGDHIAGCADVVERSAAQVMIMEGDERIVGSGGQGDFQYKSRFKPCKVRRILHDNDRVTLGGSTLVARHTPGHTRGCTTWTMQVDEDGRKLLAVIVGSPNVNPGYKLVANEEYPGIADDFKKSFALWKSLPVDLFLGAHGQYYGMEEKYRRAGQIVGKWPNPFIDREGYRTWIDAKEREFLDKLDAQQKAR